jgi:hypothetical protein
MFFTLRILIKFVDVFALTMMVSTDHQCGMTGTDGIWTDQRDGSVQGTLSEREGSVQLTTLLRKVVLWGKKISD